MTPRLRAVLIVVLVALLSDFAWDRMAFVAGLT